MIVVGVTGSLASGKSEAARLFKKHGAVIFDADDAARKVVQKGKPVYKAILKMFGKGYLKRSGELDRKKLAWHVFSHPKDLHKLNVLVHPGVIFECFKMIERCRRKKGFLVLDVPLLFESKMENLADTTVVIASKKERMLMRAREKGLSKELAKKILSTQWPLVKKAGLADFVIDNNGSSADLEKEVVKLMERIKKTEEDTKHGY